MPAEATVNHNRNGLPVRATMIPVLLALLLPAAAAAASAATPAAAAAPTPAAARQPAPRLVDVNIAGRAELKTLPGIGDAEAARIVERRPYLSKAELATKGAIPTGTYLAIRRAIVVRPRAPANR